MTAQKRETQPCNRGKTPSARADTTLANLAISPIRLGLSPLSPNRCEASQWLPSVIARFHNIFYMQPAGMIIV
jgi:hypothetical protein